MQLLDRLGVQAAFCTPDGTKTMDQQPVSRIFTVERADPLERKAAQHFQRNWRFTVIQHIGRDRHRKVAGTVMQPMLDHEAYRVLQPCDNCDKRFTMLYCLIEQAQQCTRWTASHRVSLREGASVGVADDLELNQRIDRIEPLIIVPRKTC